MSHGLKCRLLGILGLPAPVGLLGECDRGLEIVDIVPFLAVVEAPLHQVAAFVAVAHQVDTEPCAVLPEGIALVEEFLELGNHHAAHGAPGHVAAREGKVWLLWVVEFLEVALGEDVGEHAGISVRVPGEARGHDGLHGLDDLLLLENRRV